jgi:hypothetical protein
LSRSRYGHEFAEKRVSREHRVGARHGVSAREESGRLALVTKTMQEKTALSNGEDDFATTNVSERAGRDLREVARPQCGQHAFAANLQAQPAGAA